MTSMRRMAALLWWAPFQAGCSVITHADDFEAVAPPPDDRVCALCPQRTDLVHPPCPPPSPQDPQEGVHFFALRALNFGTRPSGWGTGYKVGFDRDCSDRPDGLPSTCAPRPGSPAFVSLGGGIDNAFASQVLYPLYKMVNFDPEAFVNDDIERGLGGMMLIVNGWNGQLNDDRVGARLLTSLRVMNDDRRSAPSWQGDDIWQVFADRWDPAFPEGQVPDTLNKTDKAYVRDGKLVWDARALADFQVQFGVGGALVELRLSSVVFAADMLLDAKPRLLLDGALSGVWSAFYASRNATQLAQIVARCDPCATVEYTPAVELLLRGAPDMLLPTSAGVTTCDAISIGFLGSYVEAASVGGLIPLSVIPRSCASAGVCSDDAG